MARKFFFKIFYVSGEYDLWMVFWTSGGIGDRGGGGKKMEWKKKGLDENELGRETENNRRSNKKKNGYKNIFHIDARGFPPGNELPIHNSGRQPIYACTRPVFAALSGLYICYVHIVYAQRASGEKPQRSAQIR